MSELDSPESSVYSACIEVNKAVNMAIDLPIQQLINGSAVRTAGSILERWKASDEQICSILGIPSSLYRQAKRMAADQPMDLGVEQLERVSLVLNIHAGLRQIFENPVNVYGFVTMPNHNVFFNGRAPFEVISQGDISALRETFQRIDALIIR